MLTEIGIEKDALIDFEFIEKEIKDIAKNTTIATTGPVIKWTIDNIGRYVHFYLLFVRLKAVRRRAQAQQYRAHQRRKIVLNLKKLKSQVFLRQNWQGD